MSVGMRCLHSRRLVFVALALAALLVIWFGGRWVGGKVLIARAKLALADRDAESALEDLALASRLRTSSAEVEFLSARACRRLERFDDVRSHLERAWKLGYSVQALEREQWLTLAQNGQIRDAEPHLQELLIDPGDDAAEISEAYVTGYLKTFRFEKALGLLTAWQADFPDDPQPHFLRGAYAEHVLERKLAIEEFQKAVALAPDRHDARGRLAELLVNEHRYDEAEKHYKVLLERNPSDPEVRTGWGALLLAHGRADEARSVLDGVLRDAPDFEKARLERGRLELQAGDASEAARWLEPLIERRPHDLDVRYTLASAYAAAGDAESAKPHFDYVAEARPALNRAGELVEQVSAKPEDVDLRYEAGTILLKYSDPSDGLAWLRSVLELRPDHRPTHRALADYYAQAGNHDLAERHRALAGSEPTATDRR